MSANSNNISIKHKDRAMLRPMTPTINFKTNGPHKDNY